MKKRKFKHLIWIIPLILIGSVQNKLYAKAYYVNQDVEETYDPLILEDAIQKGQIQTERNNLEKEKNINKEKKLKDKRFSLKEKGKTYIRKEERISL